MTINNRELKEQTFNGKYIDLEILCNDTDNEYIDSCDYWFEVSNYISEVLNDDYENELCNYIENKYKAKVTHFISGNPTKKQIFKDGMLFHAQVILNN